MELVIKIGGEAGMGIMASGLTLCKTLSRAGFFVFGYPEYPSLVRGGENTFQVKISDTEVNSPSRFNDIVVCLNKATYEFSVDNLKEDGIVICDSSSFKIENPKHRIVDVPLTQLASLYGGDALMRNTIALGALLALLKIDFTYLESVLKDSFSKKGEEVVKQNIQLGKAGYDYMLSNYSSFINSLKFNLKPTLKEKRMIITGNEALAIGAVRGGLKFYAVYPMTPASNIMHYLAQKEIEFDILVKQTEDEISAILYAIGASFAGVRAATGTSGGGFSLMVESLSMAGMAEVPVVIFLAQRIGPSTGMPTWTEQADLKFALNAGQGEFPRVLLAPGDASEAYLIGAEAFNIAEKYQLPVIVLTDKFLGESFFSSKKFDLNAVKIDRGKTVFSDLPPLEKFTRFKRYAFTEDGVSFRPIPGVKNGIHVTSSYEHYENGFSTENFEIRAKMVEKRMKKLEMISEKEFKLPTVYGKDESDYTILCWGSQKGPAIDAMKKLNNNNISVNVAHFTFLFPINEKKINKFFSSLNKTIMLENNYTSQFAGILREYCGFTPDYKILKYDARPFFVEDIYETVKRISTSSVKDKEFRIIDIDKNDFLQGKRVL